MRSGQRQHPGTIDGESIVAGHEQGETECDPFLSISLTDASGAEIGDKCAWTGLQNNPNADSFPHPAALEQRERRPGRLRAVLQAASAGAPRQAPSR